MIDNSEKWAVIINLKSGKKYYRQQISYLFKKLDDAGISYVHKTTGFTGHAVLIAKNFAKQDINNFLVLGGDGTISEVINGFFSAHPHHPELLKIGLVPRGTGNDWARFWGLNRDYKHAIQVFLEGNIKNVDLGKIRFTMEEEEYTRYFINSVGFGLDAAVVDRTHKLKRYVGSHAFLYTVALLWSIFRFKSNPVNMKLQDKTIEDMLFTMNIANGCYSGGGMKQNPDAIPYDGKLDGMMAMTPTLKDILTGIPMLFRGKILQHHKIISFRTDDVTINSALGGIFEADGIVVNCAPPVHVSIVPGVIKMIVP
jgi:diacylglycerol kinase (ATP)